MDREGESEELTSSSLPCDGQGNHDLKKQSSDKEKRQERKIGDLKEESNIGWINGRF